MNPAIYLCLFLPLFIATLEEQRRKKQVAAFIASRKKKAKETSVMVEIASKFLDKECIVCLFDGNNVKGTITQVSEGAILIQKSCSELEAINLDFVTRIRENPKNKDGKKKSAVLD